MKKLVKICLGPLVFALFMFLPIGGLDNVVRGAIGLLLWMLLWLDHAARRPGGDGAPAHPCGAAVQHCGDESVLATYFNDTVVLLLSANIITLAWTKWGFDRAWR